jgi:immunoglobulin-like protein involved in spore germination/sporulation and spore germination protein
MRFLGAFSLLAAALTLAGCLHDDETTTVTVRETVTETTPTATEPSESQTAVTLFFLRDGKVAPVARSVVTGPQVGRAALTELFRGPLAEDRAAGVQTAIPAELRLGSLAIENGTASVELTPRLPNRQGVAQIVYTLTQFPTVRRVSLNGGSPVGRRAFEAQTPAVLVLSPLPGAEVESGFEVTGTANTFEATFQYELRDSSNRVIADNFVTATSGSGTRGTFRFAVRYDAPSTPFGRLVVFEISAADGSRINEMAIPLQLR